MEPLCAEHQVHEIRLLAFGLGITISLVIVSTSSVAPDCRNTLVHHTGCQGANMDQGNLRRQLMN